MTPPPMLQPGAEITPNLRLVRPLGAGGMGSVWVAEHKTLRTQVVVKFMAAGLAGNAVALERFSREAAAAAQVRSPHVVQMLDHGVADGVPFIAMELLEGMDLRHYLEKVPRPDPGTLVSILGQVCKALGAAHARGIVHRDIKPDNIFLTPDPSGGYFVKLLDFGIAKETGTELAGPTRSGALIGTPYYMSPEQLVGAKDLDFPTDLWSLGIVAFEALTGRLPFQAETVGDLAVKIHQAPLPVPSQVAPGLSPAVDAWFARACAKAPRDRFTSAREMAEAFTAALQPGAASSVVPASSQAPTVGELLGALPVGPASGAAARSTTAGFASAHAVTPGAARSDERAPAHEAAPSRAGLWIAGGAAVLVLAAIGVAAAVFGPGLVRPRDPVSSAAVAAAAPLSAPGPSASSTPPAPLPPIPPSGEASSGPAIASAAPSPADGGIAPRGASAGLRQTPPPASASAPPPAPSPPTPTLAPTPSPTPTKKPNDIY